MKTELEKLRLHLAKASEPFVGKVLSEDDGGASLDLYNGRFTVYLKTNKKFYIVFNPQPIHAPDFNNYDAGYNVSQFVEACIIDAPKCVELYSRILGFLSTVYPNYPQFTNN